MEKHSESIQELTLAQLGIARQLQEIQSLITIIPIQHRILRHIIPDEIDSRRDQIIEADPETCRWLLEPVEGEQYYRQKTRKDFISWLRTGNNILHISGNPGAGKSTLMKFIGGSPRTQEELRTWAGNKQLIFGQFYFWIAGTEAQRTLPGMLRSLLYEVLSQHPELIGHVFPGQLRKMKSTPFQPDPSVEKFQDFGRKQIEEAFDLLLNKTKKSGHRICFLIDGLDEFQGGDLDHEDLAARLKDWTAGGNIKLLVSSRPWRPFLTVFTAHPTLHLHELNRFDIKTYAIRQLEQDREIRQTGVHQMRETIKDLVEQLVDQAQGIFLWAHLALDSIRQDIRRRYSVALLKAKLREYPSELDDLYDALREPIVNSPTDRKLSNRMLLLAASVPKGFPLFALVFSWLPEDDESGLLDPSFPPSTKCQPYSEKDVAERLQRVAERVNGLTRGLLELFTVKEVERRETQVRFCHQTAREYLVNNAKRRAVLEESWPDFHQSDPYGRIYLAQLIYTNKYEHHENAFLHLDHRFCRNFSLDTIRKFETPLTPLLRPMWKENTLGEGTVSFLQYAAYCRLDTFVLSEITNKSEVYLQSPGTSILLTSMYSAMRTQENYDLALGLLQSQIVKDNTIEANVVAGYQHKAYKDAQLPVWPMWVLGLICGLEEIVCVLPTTLSLLKYDSKAKIANNSLLKVCHLLEELRFELGQSLSVTVKLLGPPFGRPWEQNHSYRHGTQITFSAGQLLEFAELLNARVVNPYEYEVKDDRNLRPTGSWVLETVRDMLTEQTTCRGPQEEGSRCWHIISFKTDSPAGFITGTVSGCEFLDFRLF